MEKPDTALTAASSAWIASVGARRGSPMRSMRRAVLACWLAMPEPAQAPNWRLMAGSPDAYTGKSVKAPRQRGGAVRLAHWASTLNLRTALAYSISPQPTCIPAAAASRAALAAE